MARPTPPLRRPPVLFPLCLLGLLGLAFAGCGGGSDTGASNPADTTQRRSAATATAQSTTNACATVRPFYWEVGDGSGGLASGSVDAAGGATSFTASTPLAIASASKWLYGAYVAERRAGLLTANDVPYLNFTSGFSSFDRCLPGETVGACAADPANSTYTAAHDGRFFYGGAHMQQHADQWLALGALDNPTLATEIRNQLGTDVQLAYTQPQLAGGVQTTAANYARFLRKVMRGDLQMGKLLGAHAVCTNPATCATAVSAPIPSTESWHYGVGHWVEDDPAVGDGAFSSAGAFGFYPWIAADRSHYGVLARFKVEDQAGYLSARCGRLIRKAWLTATAL